MRSNLTIKLSNEEVASVVALLKSWGSNEIYLNNFPGEEKYYDQDGLMSDIKAKIEALAQKAVRRYRNEIRLASKKVGSPAIDVARWMVTLLVVKAFEQTDLGKAGKMDVLFKHLAPKANAEGLAKFLDQIPVEVRN